MARCDRRLIRQALTNLLQNAADAIMMRPEGEEGGAINVTVREVGTDVLISVADNGVGLPAADRARLTEPYITHKPKGTGLGLAIVKKIMEDHGGLLLLDDRPDEPGAIATLSLPVSGPPDIGSPGTQTPGTGAPSAGVPGIGTPGYSLVDEPVMADSVPAESASAEKVPDGA
jgi:two-component system nitrogen regulation sensor histidine kinase NtrY